MLATTRVFESLPDHISERVRVLRDAAELSGEFVLYWMHHAARGHENPALDAALLAAADLNLPVLVYQGLAGRHRFNSDRHHRFIMEGAREAAAEVHRRGARYAFHCPADPAAPSPLRDLAQRAALLIVEEFPAPPFPAWTRRLLDRCDAPAWSIDAACVVPMRTVTTAHDRAFKFRDDVKGELRSRLGRPWNDAASDVPPFDADLGFDAVDLASADLDELCARCRVDHALGPVAHTPGGSEAGYARWDAFKADGLKRYAKARNDAAADGVSRLSPYLHHGHVSPLRIAREAWGERGDGAEKFVDELIFWRELAHNFAYHHADELESLSVLPDWARRTLVKHADDERPAIYSWETLARGATDDALWNLAQRSLLRQGELHNNVRMTWAKALVSWTNGPSAAQEALIDLNHRFALDGNDPNSYGGLLWALGALDRPFKPEQPILGAVRPRDTETHRRRLDMRAYERKVSPPPNGERRRVAVVGVGVAGAAAARALADQGHDVRCFDKARGPGGRMSTRRSHAATYDHGAVYFTARDERFARYVRSWRDDGIVAEWEGRFAKFAGGDLQPRDAGGRFVGAPGMNAVVAHLLEDVNVSWGRRVVGLERDDEGWRLSIVGNGGGSGESADGDETRSTDPFDELVLAFPAPQAIELLRASDLFDRLDDDVRRALERARYTPTLTAMVTFADSVDVGADAVQFADHDVLGYAARLASKPGRHASDAWALHANHHWSAERLEDDPAACAQDITQSFCDTFGLRTGEAIELLGHRWRYAFVTEAATDEPPPTTGSPPGVSAANGRREALRDAELRLTMCGDWVLGPRVELAFLSGCAAAGGVLAGSQERETTATAGETGSSRTSRPVR